MRLLSLLTVAAVLAIASGADAAKRAENHFGSIYIDGKKAGQIHYTVEYDDNGAVETLKTRASLSILGIKLFNFEQNLHEAWHQGDLQTLKGRTDDDGKIYNAALDRQPDQYKGVLNDRPIELPATAFPASVWHYAIIDQPLLFDLKDFRLMNVKVARAEETLTINKRKIPTERFDFSGDWQASVWFDQNKMLVQFKYAVEGHEVRVQLDE
jgi:Domain of unknown function (DUF6134)